MIITGHLRFQDVAIWLGSLFDILQSHPEAWTILLVQALPPGVQRGSR